MDDGAEAELAAKLAVSQRHLRRIFIQQVGVTPDQLARSRRAHFARRLLDDTDLAVSDVAFAAGFGSLRQFNRVMAATFRSTPHELRALRRRTDRLIADGGLALRVPLAEPGQFDRRLRNLAIEAIPGLEIARARHYRRTVTLDGDPGVIEIGAGSRSDVRLTVHLPRIEGLIHLVAHIQRLLAGDAWDPYEVGIRTIVADHVGPAAAPGVLGETVTRYGTPIEGLRQVGLTHLFPTPAGLATADLEDTGLGDAGTQAVRDYSSSLRE